MNERMKNSRTGMGVVVIFGLAAWLFANGIPKITPLKPAPAPAPEVQTEEKAAEVVASDKVDFRDPKVRAAQEAAYNKKFHPDAQGAVMQYPEKAIKIIDERDRVLSSGKVDDWLKGIKDARGEAPSWQDIESE
jgi:hypothetical protein